MKTEQFRCECGKKIKGRKVNFDSFDLIVCPNCKRKHYIDSHFTDWKKANESKYR